MKSSFEEIRNIVGPHKKTSFEKFGGIYTHHWKESLLTAPRRLLLLLFLKNS
jgi:hypothetical protein